MVFGSDQYEIAIIVSNIEFQIEKTKTSSHVDCPAPSHTTAPQRAPLRAQDVRWPRARRARGLALAALNCATARRWPTDAATWLGGVARCWPRRRCALVAHRGRADHAMGGAWPRGCCTLADRWSSAGRTKWSTMGSAGRGDARRWMRARLHGDARGLAPACALAARVNSRWRRRSGDVMTAGLISSRVWFGPVPGSP
ncbi:hypothetical protein F511_45559 [Dorcoceras hygrometricum]|uniref:Uncharacterized protein n=1 Tax=Dorcoceras hygrometricum TaxID=472368 RepID=A0A2Z6ZVL3_9LAMI|nr:hypothetical protein F511_45559 [Dorcoceras hygrometricum]